MRAILALGAGLLALMLTGCDVQRPAEWTVPGRWYTQAQVEHGREVFHLHCASCHGLDAEGTEEWWIPEDNGYYPPPPLNGTAHAWHHPKAELLQFIEHGGVPLGGQMPAFGHVLSEAEMIATIAFFQSYWSDEIYQRWSQIDRR